MVVIVSFRPEPTVDLAENVDIATTAAWVITVWRRAVVSPSRGTIARMLAGRTAPMTPEEYLQGELESRVKHEYVGGAVYAMAGAENQHNDIAGNVFAGLHSKLRGKPCRPYNSDTKVRIRLPSEVRFYYPDVQVTCRPNAAEDTFQDSPSVIVEVLSDGTRRADEGEKREAYVSLPSLETYLLVETDEALVVAFQRTSTGFVREVHAGLEAVIPLPSLDVNLPLSEIYEGVALAALADVR